jgi:uncharacterized membrane protein
MSTLVDRVEIAPLRISRIRAALALAISLHFAFLVALGLFRHWGYLTSLHDLGLFDQAVWGVLNGHGLLNTPNFDAPASWLGMHFNPVLMLFAPLYAIYPAAEWFMIAQAAALSVAAWPVFLLASRVFESERVGVHWAIAYLFNPFLLNAAAWDFHPVTLAVPLIAASLLAVEKEEGGLLTLCCAGLLLIQEQFGLTVLGFGLLWGFKTRKSGLAIALTAVGLAHFYLVLGVIMPALSPTGTQLMMDQNLGQHTRYGWLGSSIGEMLKNMLWHPVAVFRIVIIEFGGAKYLVFLLLPSFGLSVLGPMFLLPGLADLAANFLSSNPMPRSVASYHSVTLVPTLIAAAIYGSKRAAPWIGRFISIPVWKLVMLTSLALAYVLAPLPLPGALNQWAPTQFFHGQDPTIHIVRTAVGKQTSVSVQSNVGAHFSQRPQVFYYPRKVGEADAIVLWLESPTGRLTPDDPTVVGTLSHHLEMKQTEYLASIDCLLSHKEYGVALWRDPWLVFSRNAIHQTDIQPVKQKLEALRKAWAVSPENYQAALQSCS